MRTEKGEEGLRKGPGAPPLLLTHCGSCWGTPGCTLGASGCDPAPTHPMGVPELLSPCHGPLAFQGWLFQGWARFSWSCFSELCLLPLLRALGLALTLWGSGSPQAPWSQNSAQLNVQLGVPAFPIPTAPGSNTGTEQGKSPGPCLPLALWGARRSSQGWG